MASAPRLPRRSDGAAMFNVPNSLLNITGGTFNQIVGAQKDPRKIIQKAFRDHVASDATHDSNAVVDPPRCHPNTRTAILRRLREWARNPGNRSLVLWLFGPAGAGKTAIARSLAELLSDQGLLAASFFFFRTAAKRNNERLLISTIAYQMTLSIPEIQPYIVAVVEEDPFVFEQSFQTQLRKLIVNPIISLSSVTETAPSSAKLVIIDGLDECNTSEAQGLVLRIISDTLPLLAGRLKFLILSRQEYHIETAFSQPALKASTAIIDLKHDLTSYDDIRIFLREKFEEIKRTHPLHSQIDPAWPGEEIIEILVRRSSGNFVYPRTVMRYIETTYDRPQKRLKVILDLLPSSDSPYAELDNLYRHILSHVRLPRPSLLKMLGVLILCKGPYMPDMSHPSQIEALLLLESGDLLLRLIDLRSLISSDEGSPGSLSDVKFLHTSFSDFLLDASRSEEFHVDMGHAWANVALGSVKIVTTTDFTTARCSCKPVEDCQHWVTEMTYMDALRASFVNATHSTALESVMLTCNFTQFYNLLSTSTFYSNKPLWDFAWTHLDTYLTRIRLSNAFKNTGVLEHHLSEFGKCLQQDFARYPVNDEALVNLLVLFSCIVDFDDVDNRKFHNLAHANDIWEAFLLLNRHIAAESESTIALATYGLWAWWMPSPLDQEPCRLVYAFDTKDAMCSSLSRLFSLLQQERRHITPVIPHPRASIYSQQVFAPPQGCYSYVVQALLNAEASGPYSVTSTKLTQVTMRCLSFVCAPRGSSAAQHPIVAVKCHALVSVAVILLVRQMYDTREKHGLEDLRDFIYAPAGNKQDEDLISFFKNNSLRPVALGGWTDYVKSYTNLAKLIQEYQRIFSEATSPAFQQSARALHVVIRTKDSLWTPINSEMYFRAI